MEANNILSANLLDIIFEGKNKDYGAYELRKTYNKRISISLIISMGIFAVSLTGFVIANKYSSQNLIDINGPDVIIQPPPPDEHIPPPLPRKLLPPPPVATIAYLPPVVHKDIDVIEPPPEIQELLDAKIDSKTVEGTKDVGNIAPPVDVTGTQVVAIPVKKKNDDTVFLRVEIDATFRGGAGEWTKYVSKEIQRSNDEFTEADFGTCVVKFIVDKAGKVSHVEATTMKGSKLAEIATNAIRKGPDWIPAQQNGMYVNAYRIQPVTLNNPDK